MSQGIFASVFIGTVFFLSLHVLIWRWRPSNNPRVFRLTFLGGASLPVTILAQVSISGFEPAGLSAAVALEILAVTSYLFIYAGVARSVSVTLLTRILSSGQSSLDAETLCQEYLSSSRFEDRVQLMHESGLVSLVGQSVKLTPKGWRFARSLKILERIFSDGLEG